MARSQKCSKSRLNAVKPGECREKGFRVKLVGYLEIGLVVADRRLAVKLLVSKC